MSVWNSNRQRPVRWLCAVLMAMAASGKVADLKASLGRAYPQVAPLLPSLHVAVGTDYADDDTALSPDVSVACFPPVSGG